MTACVLSSIVTFLGGGLSGSTLTILYNRRASKAVRIREFVKFVTGWYADIESVAITPDPRCVSDVFGIKRSDFLALAATVRDCIPKNNLHTFDEYVSRISHIDILAMTPQADRGKTTTLAVMKPLIQLIDPRKTAPANQHLGDDND